MVLSAKPFSWSKSRDNKFNECLRQYFYHYYGSWGGWFKNASSQKRKLYMLKNLDRRSQWVGSVVHDTIEWVLKRLKQGSKPELSESLAKLRSQMEQDWASSLRGEYRSRPKKAFGLAEHYYGQRLDDESFEEAYSRAQLCMENFFKTEIYQRLARRSTRIVESEKLSSIYIAGEKVWVKSDLVFRDYGGLTIVDWKTGQSTAKKEDEISRQLTIYALYASRRLYTELEDIEAVIVDLYTGTEIYVDVDALAEEVEQYIKNSMKRMKALFSGPRRDQVRLSDFPMTDDLEVCRKCNFRRMCNRG